MSGERKEYKEVQIMRSRSPAGRHRSSNQNLSQFDSNLDHLLEDLQNSVSRPGSALGQTSSSTYKERYVSGSDSGYGKTNSLSRNLKSNPVNEYSSDDAYTYTSPDGREKVQTYKKEKFSYGKSTDLAPERSRMQNSINQLDSLLDDLQQAKKSSYTEKVNRELHYGDTPPSHSRTFERLEEKSYKKGYSSDDTYGDIKPLRPISPAPSSRTSTLTRQTKVNNVHEYPIRVLETPVPDIDPEVLAHLDPNLHPAGNTKVTTTIKTYTYEIPGSGDYPTQVREDTTVNEEYRDKMEKYVYSPNDTITTPSKSFAYNKTENKENYYKQEPAWKDSAVQKSYQELIQKETYRKPVQPAAHTTVEEEITTIRNYQPGYQAEREPPNRNQTYTYNESVITKNVDYPAPAPPATQETREYFKETNVINRSQPPMSERGYPVYNPPGPEPHSKTYLLKESSHTTKTNNNNNNYPPQQPSTRHQRDVEIIQQKQTVPEPINIQYSYKSTNKSENRYKTYPDETDTLLPKKFPTNDAATGPPKRIDELMASIGNEPPNSPLNAGFTAHEREVAHKKVIESYNNKQSEVEDLQKKEPLTKNVSGPPVYYPPGHEMFAKKEEAGWRAQGEYAKGDGKYLYGSDVQSEMKTKKGMAVIPVCLPLCCGLPCTII